MAFRPEWEQNRRRGAGGGIRSWSALRTILTLTIGVWLVKAFLISSQAYDSAAFITHLFGLRAWWPSGSFNFAFPLQLVTYMLDHGDFWHLFKNMLFFYFLGQELEGVLGRAGLYRLYITGGVVGGLVQWMSYVISGASQPVIGASGAVFAIMVLYAFKWPRRQMYIFPIPFPIPIYALVAVYVGVNILGLAGGGSGNVSVLAHLGGAAVGFLWHRQGDLVQKATHARKRVVHEKQRQQGQDDRREMDRILGKIQATGLGSLSPKEKAFLDRRSQELRDQQGR